MAFSDGIELRRLPGSERRPAPGLVGSPAPLDPESRIEVRVVLRRPGGPPDPTQQLGSAAEFADRYGADLADVRLVTSALTALGVEIAEVDPASRRVRVAGPAGLLGRIFGTSWSRSPAPALKGGR